MAVRSSRTWQVGETDERDLYVAIPRSRSDIETWPWETIVISTGDRLSTPELWEVHIEQADFGGVLGPIHLPCTVHVPGALKLRVRPVGPVTVATTIFATTYVADHRGFRSFAIWSKVMVLGEVLPIPQWVRAVGCLDPAQFRYLDRLGVPLSSSLDSDNDRPHLAVSVECMVPGVVAFYY
jgi:hypothetical protein